MPRVPIGNDVIDLDDAEIVDHHLRPRFVARVLATEERERLARTPDREKKELLWTLFAAKEAAYKVVTKLRGPIVFAHRSFVVGDDCVRFEELVLRLQLVRGPGFVHAIAFVGDVRPIAHVELIDAGEDASHAARRILRESLARSLGCATAELEIVRDEAPGTWTGRSPPRVLLRGSPLEVDVSLSHDGRFVAMAHEMVDQGVGSATM